MAYENGAPMNRYANKRRHIDRMKRRNIGPEYASYEAFRDHFRSLFGERREDGMLEFQERYWKNSYFQGDTNWKCRLKYFARRKRRRYNDEVCHEMTYLIDPDDCNNPNQDRFDDPWNWD